MTKYAVVDLSNLIHRCRHITQGDAYTKAGLSLQILFRSLRKLYRENHINHIVFAIDAGSWRTDVYPQYKAKRKLNRLKLKPTEKEENDVFFEILKALIVYLREKTRCTVLEHWGIEGDDFVARWVQNHPNDQHIIVSGDSDFVQLLASNVKIFDGVQERMLTIQGIMNTNNELMEFSIQSKDGKIKVGNPNPNFLPEQDWWQKALFVKVIRGDASDGIFSAYPRVRFPVIEDVWQDRKARGFHWNNFFQQEWEKFLGIDEFDNKIVKKVRVIDEYKINSSLINLNEQPDQIKQIMDGVIERAIHKPVVKNVGILFLRFCGQNDLKVLAQEAADHAIYLNSGVGEIHE